MTSKVSPLSKPVLIALATLLSIYAAASAVSMWIFQTTREYGLTMGDDPPLSSIRQDFLHGTCLAAGLVLYAGFVLLVFRRHWKEIFPVSIGALCFFPYPIVWASIIYARSSHLFDTRNAQVPWPTFEEYVRIREYAFVGTMILFVAVILIWRFVKGRGTTNPSA